MKIDLSKLDGEGMLHLSKLLEASQVIDLSMVEHQSRKERLSELCKSGVVDRRKHERRGRPKQEMEE